jgi:hypothetical protein
VRDEPVADCAGHGGHGRQRPLGLHRRRAAARSAGAPREHVGRHGRYAQALRTIAAYDTRSALVVCDELGVLGLPAVGLDEAGLMKTADHIERMLPLP